MSLTSGFATAAGTARFRDRFPQLTQAGHFRHSPDVPEVSDLWLSSIGLGTYLGDPTDAADRDYTDAIVHAVQHGINVLDTAINYRHQRSERNLGAALQSLITSGQASRDELLICTKAGYLPFDHDMPPDAVGYLRQEYVATGVAPAAEIVGGSHCMAPRYLADQIERSRRNLQLATIDVFYLHNPETQLGHVPKEAFYQRLQQSFEFLEGAVRDGKIRWYGAATWGGFRANPADRSHLSLEIMVDIARHVAGDKHHFRFVQLPFNLAMLEAYGYGNQIRNGEAASLLVQAPHLGVAVVGSGTLSQGNLAQGVPPQLQKTLGASTDAEAAIQFARSATNLTTSLVGMGRAEHVETNLKVAAHPAIPRENWEGLFSSK
jgi:aryl-alcohol dehydrogenase-like predicted oxidoreductase